MTAGDLIASKSLEGNLLDRVAKLEAEVAQLKLNQRQPLVPPDYTTTGTSTLRTLASTSVLADVINVVATMINDLIAQGRFK